MWFEKLNFFLLLYHTVALMCEATGRMSFYDKSFLNQFFYYCGVRKLIVIHVWYAIKNVLLEQDDLLKLWIRLRVLAL